MRRKTAERGSALVELAVCLPVLMSVVFFTVDFGRAYYIAMTLSNAARAGAQQGARSQVKATDIAAMAAAATNAAVDLTGISVSAQRVCACASSDGTVITNQSCTAGCGGHIIQFAQVDVSKTFLTQTNLPGIPSSVLISRRATMRVAPN